MRKLKITVALLVMLLVCHALFAAYVPVEKADPTLVNWLGVFCDVLQNYTEGAADPVGELMKIAALPDESLRSSIKFYLADRPYESVTSVEQLAAIFPRGVEETNEIDQFRRAAFHLAVYTARNGRLFPKTRIDLGGAQFNIFGYDFFLMYDGENFIFKFVDIIGEEEFKAIVTYLGSVIPGAQTWSYPKPGRIEIKAPGLTDFGFQSAVKLIESRIYGTFL